MVSQISMKSLPFFFCACINNNVLLIAFMLQLIDLILVVGINANAPVFVRYWDLRSLTRSGFGEMSGTSPRGRQPNEFADPSGDSV